MLQSRNNANYLVHDINLRLDHVGAQNAFDC